MFRILIVEDVLSTLDELRELLQGVFPNAIIETASNISDGEQRIRASAADNCFFNIAVLDFMLPRGKGESLLIDESLCQAIKILMPNTLVIHITSYNEDPTVIEHNRLHHSGKDSSRGEFIHKTAYWPEKLLVLMKSSFIEQQIRWLEDKSWWNTQNINMLVREISNYWDGLDEVTKAKVRRYFNVSEDQTPVNVSLRMDLFLQHY